MHVWAAPEMWFLWTDDFLIRLLFAGEDAWPHSWAFPISLGIQNQGSSLQQGQGAGFVSPLADHFFHHYAAGLSPAWLWAADHLPFSGCAPGGHVLSASPREGFSQGTQANELLKGLPATSASPRVSCLGWVAAGLDSGWVLLLTCFWCWNIAKRPRNLFLVISHCSLLKQCCTLVYPWFLEDFCLF